MSIYLIEDTNNIDDLERVQMKCLPYQKEDNNGIKCPKTSTRQSERKGPDFFLIPNTFGMISVKEVLALAIFILHLNSKRVNDLIAL